MGTYYDFKVEDVRRFAEHVGIKTYQRGNELIFEKCPYCKNQTDKKYKFAINLTDGQFHCFRASCGVKGNMITLSKDFNFQLSEAVDRYINRNGFNNRFKRFKEGHRETTNSAIEYMKSRGISEEVCKKYELTTKTGDDRILVFPFKDQNGELKFIKYRNMDFKKDENSSKEWSEKNCMPILFGMNHCSDGGQLIITEGQIDALSVIESGMWNAVSVPTGANGTTWIPHCYDWMQRFNEFIVFGDCENGIVTLSEMIKNRFGKKKKVRIVRQVDYQNCKDANEILQKYGKEAVRKAIENAEATLSNQVMDMADVKFVDMSKIPKIKTGYEEIDKKLNGGMMYGQVILLTGKRGNGKSTFGSQLVCEAINQEQNCFIYSGELPNFWVKAWIDGQIFGHSKLNEKQVEQCEEWYKGKLFIFNNEIIETDELDDLLTVLEDTVVKKDIKFVLLDNLMTAIEAETDEKLFRRQSNFVGKLAKMAKTFNLVILLIAHPRKSRAEFQNDDVSGSADITNRVDVVMSYDRKDDLPEDVRVLKITKNRLTGKLGEIMLYYSEDSKRISDSRSFSQIYLTDMRDATNVPGDPWTNDEEGLSEIPF